MELSAWGCDVSTAVADTAYSSGINAVFGLAGGGGDVDYQPVGPDVGGDDPSGLVDGYICRFLTDAGVLSANDGVTTIPEMRGFVRGRVL